MRICVSCTISCDRMSFNILGRSSSMYRLNSTSKICIKVKSVFNRLYIIICLHGYDHISSASVFALLSLTQLIFLYINFNKNVHKLFTTNMYNLLPHHFYVYEVVVIYTQLLQENTLFKKQFMKLNVTFNLMTFYTLY